MKFFPGRHKTLAKASCSATTVCCTASKFVKIFLHIFRTRKRGTDIDTVQTDTNGHGQSVTTLWRTIRANKEDRVAKLEWAPNGGLGRAVIGKVEFFYLPSPCGFH